MKRYKAILVGNGTMGKRHRIRFEACDVQFVAVVDNLAEFNEIADKLNFGNPVEKETCTNGMQASQEVDFVVISSPATTHYAYAKFFVERKIPVFVEKPLAIAGEEAQELVDLAVKNDTLLFVAQSECYNPLFLNFRKHFLAELNMRGHVLHDAGNVRPDAGNVRLEFRREHKYSERCRDVNVALDLLVHDLSLFFTMFRSQDVDAVWFETGQKSENDPANFDSAKLRLTVARGPHQGVVADFYVNRSSDCDVRTIAVDFARVTNPCNRSVVVPESNYVISLSYYTSEGEVVHIPDSLDNEHRFFLKLLAGACADWGHRAAQNAADCVKFASEQ